MRPLSDCGKTSPCSPAYAGYGCGWSAVPISLAILAGGRGANLNMRAAFLEVANDALGSVAVIVAALAALATGWGRPTPSPPLLIAALMAPHLLQRSTAILMEATLAS